MEYTTFHDATLVMAHMRPAVSDSAKATSIYDSKREKFLFLFEIESLKILLVVHVPAGTPSSSHAALRVQKLKELNRLANQALAAEWQRT